MVASVLVSLVLLASPVSRQKDMGASYSASLSSPFSLRGLAEIAVRIESPEGEPRLPSSSALREAAERQLRGYGVPLAKIVPQENPFQAQDPSRPTLSLRLRALRTLSGTYALDVELKLASRTKLPSSDPMATGELVRWNRSVLALVEKGSMSYGVRTYVDQLLREFGEEYRGMNRSQEAPQP